MNPDEWMVEGNYKIILIDEEYGSDQWYAIVTKEEYRDIVADWRTIKGLNCLVPVRFLIPQAQNPPILPEHERFKYFRTLYEEKVEIIPCHIHETDDSHLGSLRTQESNNFCFRGREYGEEEVLDLFKKYQNFSESRTNLGWPGIWRAYDNKGDLLRKFVEAEWPEDDMVPEGWIRQGQVIVREKYTLKKTGKTVINT